jgi:hypothetical protein
MIMKRGVLIFGCLALLAVCCGCAGSAALLITSQSNQTVREYNGTNGVFVKVAASGGALGDPLGVVIGLDGNLLVSDGQTNQVKRYDRATGAFMDVFASTNLAGPSGMTIYQGVLYVANSNPPQGVQRFDAATGVNTGNFVPSLSNPSPRDVKVNPANGRLYVLYYNAATVETLMVPRPSPPVPQVSTTTPAGTRSLVARARIAVAAPTTSSTVSPFMRSATRNAPICAGVASPSMMQPTAAAISSALASFRAQARAMAATSSIRTSRGNSPTASCRRW